MLLQPVDVERALRKQPYPADLHELVRVAQSGNHQAPLSTVDREVMCQGVGLSCGSVGGQRQDRALSDEVRGRVVLVQVCEDSASRECNSCEGVGSLVFMYTTKWVSAVKKSHLTFRVAPIGAVCIRLDKRPADKGRASVAP